MKNGNSSLKQQVLSLENSLKNALELLTMARADVQKSSNASSSKNKAPEVDDPYTDYLNQCHKYGRQFNCEAMVRRQRSSCFYDVVHGYNIQSVSP